MRDLLLAGLAAAAIGCAHRQENLPLLEARPSAGYRPLERALDGGGRDPELFVCLTFSGGGTRASALSYGVLEELRQRAVRVPGTEGERRLLDEVDVISSVSGGSFTAAYYALFGDRIFEEFSERMLQRNLQSALLWRAVNPVSWWRMLSPSFSRIDLAAEIYDRSIFEGRTFADLGAHPERPTVLMNATDMANRQQFIFTQDYFDLLGSDLDRYPVSSAVAASSAFPVLLTAVSLENHPAPTGYEVPAWIQNRLTQETERELRLAFESATSYHYAKEDNPYVHLGDGGMSDNLGLAAVLEPYGALMDDGRIRRSLFIVVNAKNSPQHKINKTTAPPGLFGMIKLAGTISMDRFTFASLDRLHTRAESRRRLEDTYRAINDSQDALLEAVPEEVRPAVQSAISEARARQPRLRERRMYIVEVTLEDIEDAQQRRYFQEMPTSFSLDDGQIEDLTIMGAALLREHPEYQRFLQDLDAE